MLAGLLHVTVTLLGISWTVPSFLISNSRPVLTAVCSLLGNSPASELLHIISTKGHDLKTDRTWHRTPARCTSRWFFRLLKSAATSVGDRTTSVCATVGQSVAELCNYIAATNLNLQFEHFSGDKKNACFARLQNFQISL